jgi:branched-chain amino acid transport system substrate-binding protein
MNNDERRHQMSRLFRTARAALVVAIFAGAFGAAAAEKELVIGQNDALSGGGAVYGIPQQRAVQLAVEEINAKGGVKVGPDNYRLKVIVYDDKANPTEATNAVRKLLDRDGVKYLLGFCCSGPTSAVASFIGREDAVMLVGTAAERSITTQGNPNLFRTRPPADYTGAAAGAFVASRGVKTLAVIGALDVAFYQQYLNAFEQEFTKAGGRILAKESFASSDRDMTPQLTKVRGLNPDAIFVLGYVEQSAFVYRQATELGLKMPRYGFTGGSEAQFLKVATSEQMEGVWDLRPTELTVEALGPTAVAFVANYKKKFNDPPTPNAPYAYDQVYVLKHALENAGSVDSTKKVIEAIRQLAPPAEVVLKYAPIGGRMFDENGQAYISNGAFQWRQGKWLYVSDLPSDAAAYSRFLRTLRK